MSRGTNPARRVGAGRRPPAPGWGSRWIWAGSGRHSGAPRNDVSGPPSLSLREVADRAGVAMSSVSRVLSGHPDVSVAMRARVMAVVDELGYVPNMLAASLRRGSTMTVGAVRLVVCLPLFAAVAV